MTNGEHVPTRHPSFVIQVLLGSTWAYRACPSFRTYPAHAHEFVLTKQLPLAFLGLSDGRSPSIRLATIHKPVRQFAVVKSKFEFDCGRSFEPWRESIG